MTANFDPSNIKQSDMNLLADSLENYVNNLQSVMIIPDKISKKDQDKIKNGLMITKKLIKKLRKGDTSVFREIDNEDLFI